MARSLARGFALSAILIFAVALDWSAGAKRAQAAATDGLVAAYGFSEGSGATTADASGNNNTGMLKGAGWTAAGVDGSALSFNGSGAYVDLGNGATLQLTGSMTVSAWIRSAAFPFDDAAVVSKRTGGTNVGFQLDTTIDAGPRTIGFKLTTPTGALMARYGATALQLNQWYHISGVYDAAAQTLDVYLNGVLDNGKLVGTVTSAQQNSTPNVDIGRRAGLGGFEFNGTIDEVRIYNRALSPSDIQVDMQLAVAGGALADTAAPSAPGALIATPAGSAQINLAWGAASDNFGVTGYRVERCAGSGCTTFAQIAAPTGTSFSDTGLSAATTYSYRVRATDAAGNLGAYSNVTSATTAQAADLTSPTAPASLTAVVAGSAQINLAWTASTDNVGVTGYLLERCAGSGCTSFAQVATPTGTSFSDNSVSAATSYSYRVRAADAAGNLGAYSNAASATTSGVSTTASPGLVAAYGFSEGSGATTADASGNNNTGTLNGATWSAAGVAGNALSFNGNGAYVDLGNGGTLQLTSSMTVSAWIRPAGFPVDDAAVVSKRTGGTNVGFQLDTTVDRGPRTIGFKLTTPTGTLMARYGATALQLNQWYHISGVYDATAQTLDVYLNGVLDNGALVGSVSSTQQNSTLNVNVGRRSGLAAFAFNGLIDEVHIYSRALTQAQVQGDMGASSGGTVPPPDTIAPSAPGTLTATASGSAQVNLSWGAASDNVGVSAYRVERCAGAGCTAFAQIAIPAGTSFSDTGLSAATSYSYRVRAADAAGNLGTYSNAASATTAQSAVPAAFPVVASANKRYLQDQNGTPFPILGRTAWFITSLAEADYRTFLDDTAAKGYNAIEFMVITHHPNGNQPPFGDNGTLLPFLKRLDGAPWTGLLTYATPTAEAPDFSQPNEAFWLYIDGLLSYAESKGIVCFLFPAYAGFQGGDQGWMLEMTANGSTKMNAYGAFLANRYKARGNIVWMLGGDFGTGSAPFNQQQKDAENAMLAGLKSVAGQQSLNFSAEWNTESIYTDQSDATLKAAGTLQGAYSFFGDVNTQARRGYSASPVMPTFLLEEPYDEEGPDGNNVNGAATQPVRRFQWWGWLSGIGGYMSGNGFVWPFNTGVWQDHLNTQGAQDMARLNAFIRSIAWQNLVPSGLGGMKTLVTAGGSTPSASDYVAASATPDGTLLVAYVPPAHSGSITIDMTAMSKPAQARWFNPTSGAYAQIGTGIPNTGSFVFDPPGNNGSGFSDWVLVLDTP